MYEKNGQKWLLGSKANVIISEIEIMKPFVYFWTTFSFRQRGFWHVFLFSIMFILNKVINVMIISPGLNGKNSGETLRMDSTHTFLLEFSVKINEYFTISSKLRKAQ